jgi:acyl transferase domain-containing protein
VQPWLATGLLEVLYPRDRSSALLHEAAYTQPALFALEYALCALWKSWGIEPAVVLGHSLGEYVAACVAGVFSLEDALKLVAACGRLVQALPREGAMIAVTACPERVAAAIAQCGGEVSIAAVNGPQSVVISGRRAAVEALDAAFQQEGVQTQALPVSHAFHSPLMEAVLEPFAKVVGEVRFGPPRIDLISNLYGRLAPEQISTPEYWYQHMRAPVQFAAGMQTLQQMGVTCFVEVGPKPVLLGMGRQCLTHGGEVLWLPSLRPGRPDGFQMLESLGQLYVHGAAVDWLGFDGDRRRRRLRLPNYPFQRRRCWFEPATMQRVKTEARPSPPISADAPPNKGCFHRFCHSGWYGPRFERSDNGKWCDRPRWNRARRFFRRNDSRLFWHAWQCYAGDVASTLATAHLTLHTPVTTASGNMSSTVCLASSELLVLTMMSLPAPIE